MSNQILTVDEALSVAENCPDSTMGDVSKILAAEVRRLQKEVETEIKVSMYWMAEANNGEG